MNAVTFKEVTVPLANSEAFSNCALPPAEDLMFEMTPAVTRRSPSTGIRRSVTP